MAISIKRLAGLAMLLLVGAALCGGCASGPKFCKAESVPPGQGVVHVYRPVSGVGWLILPTIQINGENVGRLVNGGYISKTVPAGRTEVYANTEAPASIIVNVEDGKQYYVREHINLGFWVGRPALQEMTEPRAMPEISKCRGK